MKGSLGRQLISCESRTSKKLVSFRTMAGQGAKGGDVRKRRRVCDESPMVVLSKQLSWLLRHHLDTSGLEVRNDGYVRIAELVLLLIYELSYS
jgi:RNA:NAD 2'-phosphotransferase (TPT1/KptA family)